MKTAAIPTFCSLIFYLFFFKSASFAFAEKHTLISGSIPLVNLLKSSVNGSAEEDNYAPVGTTVKLHSSRCGRTNESMITTMIPNENNHAFYEVSFWNDAALSSPIGTTNTIEYTGTDITQGKTPNYLKFAQDQTDLLYNTTYYVAFRVKANVSDPWSGYGPACTVQLGNDVKLRGAYCNKDNMPIYSPIHPDKTTFSEYKVNIYTDNGSLVGSYIYDPSGVSSKFTDFINQDPAHDLEYNKNYKVRFQVKNTSGSIWSPEGPECTVKFSNRVVLSNRNCNKGNLPIYSPIFPSYTSLFEYKMNVYTNTDNLVGSRVFKFSQGVPKFIDFINQNPAAHDLNYNETYKVKFQVKNSASSPWSPEGTACTVNFSNRIVLSNRNCNKENLPLSSPIFPDYTLLDNYQVYIYTNGGSLVGVHTFDLANGTPLFSTFVNQDPVAHNLEPGKTYKVKFRVKNTATSAWSPLGNACTVKFSTNQSANNTSLVTYPAYFEVLEKSHYNWGMKALYPSYEVSSYTDESFAISHNKLLNNVNGHISFVVSDHQPTQTIGFVQERVGDGFPTVYARIEQRANQFFFQKNGETEVALPNINVGSKVTLSREGDAIKVRVDGQLIYTLNSSGLQSEELKVGVSFGTSSSGVIGLTTSFKSTLGLDEVNITAAEEVGDADGKGSIAIETENNQQLYGLWGNASLLTPSAFDAQKANWPAIGRLSYNDYLSGFPTQKGKLESGTYITAVSNALGEKIQLEVMVPTSDKWETDGELELSSVGLEKTGTTSDWATGKASSDNTFHPGETGAVYFRYNKGGEAAVGLRSLNEGAGVNYEQLTYGFFFDENEAVPVLNGVKQQAIAVAYNKGDYFGFEVTEDKIFYLKNGRKLLGLTAQLTFKHILAIAIKSPGSLVYRPLFVKASFWPIVEMEQVNSICGKVVQKYTLNAREILTPKGSRTYNYSWRNEQGNTVASGLALKDVPVGQYKLTYMIDYPNGLSSAVRSPITYLVGYKAIWTNKVETESVPTTNAIRNTLANFNNNIHTAETSNHLEPLTSEWVYFEVTDSKSTSDRASASYPPIFDRYYSIDFQSYNGVPYLSAHVYHVGGASQVLNISSGTTLFNVPVNVKDQVLIKIIGGNSVKLSINGQDMTSISGNIQESFSGIANSSILGFKSLFFNSSSFDSKIGPANMITSFPCSDLVYLNLKRKVDGAYYSARLNTLGFRYIEEYTPNSGLLSYRILDKHNEDVFASNNVTPPPVYRQVGDNKCEIDLGVHRNMLPSGFYVLEVVNDKGEKRFMKFRLY